jgi:hypothetical protein
MSPALIAALVALAALAYVLAAYVLLPALWKHHEHQPGFEHSPMMTTTSAGIPGDPMNVGLVADEREIAEAMERAGWQPADPITTETSLEIAGSVLLDRPYPDAPVSSLYYEGRKQDLAFEKAEGGSARRRHHVRFWLTLERGAEGRQVWLGAASFDSSVGLSHNTGQITHHIAPDIDSERDGLIADLSGAGMLVATYQVSGVGPTLFGRNGGGDRYYTDGEVTVGIITEGAAESDTAPSISANPTAVHLKNGVWRWARSLFK